MTETMKFGPDWIRSLSSVENTMEAPKYQLADHRYGREEMLALYNKVIPAPENLSSISSLYVEKSQAPLSVLPMTTEEIRIWNMSFNSDHLASRPMTIRSGSSQSSAGDGVSGSSRGRGMLMERGRGRGGPRPMYHYNTKSYGEAMETNALFGTRVRPFERTQSQGSNDRSWSERNGASDYNSFDWNGYGNSENGLSTSPRKDHHTNRLSRDETSWRRRPGKDDDDTQKERRTTHRTNFINDRYEKNAWSNWRDSSERNKDRDKISSELMETGRDRRWIRSGTSPSRTQRRSSECRDDNLPEWATENAAVAGGGTFDSTGAFHGSISDDEEDRKMKSQRSRFKKKVDKEGKSEKDEPTRRRKESYKNESQDKNDSEKERENRRLYTDTGDPGAKKDSEGRISVLNSETYEKEESQGFTINDSTMNHNRSSQLITNKYADNSNYPPNFKVNGNSTNLPLPDALPPVQLNKSNTELLGRNGNQPYADHRSGVHKEQDLDGIVVDMVSKIVADDERFQDRLGRNDEYNKWYYRDPNCEVQGPFSTEEMSDWYRMGYFKESALEIRRGTETRYQTMEELMSRTEEGRSPFNGEIVIPLEEVAKLQNQAAQQPKPSLITNSDSLEENLLRQQRYQQQVQYNNMLSRRNELIQEGMRYFTQHERYRNLTVLEQQRLLSHYVTTEMDSQFPTANFAQNNVSFISPHLQQQPQPLQQIQMHQQLQQQQKMQDPKAMDRIQQHTLNSVPLVGSTVRPQVPRAPNLNNAMTFARDNQITRSDTEINPIQNFLKQLGMPQDQPIKMDPPWTNNASLPPAFNAQHWLSQVGPIGPSAPIPTQNWIEPQPTTVTMKTERQIIEETLLKEEEKRKLEELKAEQERQLLMMLRNQEQRNKSEEKEQNQQMKREQQAKSTEEERIRQLLKLEKEEEKKRTKEVGEEKRRKKLEEEKKRILEEQNKKKKEDERVRKEEAKKKEYEKRKEEEQRKKEEEEKKLEKEKKQEMEKKKLEQKKKKEEEKKKTVNDNQKKEEEKMAQSLKRIEEQRQQAEIAKSKKLPKSQSAPAVSVAAPPVEKKKQKQKTDKTQMKWESKMPPPKVKSLTEIQAEEQKQLKEQIEKEKKERLLRQQREAAEAAAASTAKETNPWVVQNAWENGKPAWVLEATTTVVNGKKKKKEKIEKPGTSEKSQIVTLSRPKKNESKAKVKDETKPKDELSRWCITKLSKLKRTPDGLDVRTFVTVLNYSERRDEIQQSVTNYLIDKASADNFLAEYLMRRPELSGQGNNRKKENESKKQPVEFTEVKGKMKKNKKSKMARVDNKILGFNVTAAPDRINVGDRDYVE